MAFKNDKQRRAAFARMGKDYHSMNPDMAKRAVNTLPDTPSNRKKWVEDSRRIDIEGLDTPTVKPKSISSIKDNSSLPKKEQAGEKATMEQMTVSEVNNFYSNVDTMEINLHNLVKTNQISYEEYEQKKRDLDKKYKDFVHKIDTGEISVVRVTQMNEIPDNGYTGLALAKIHEINRMIKSHNASIRHYGEEGFNIKKETLKKEKTEIDTKMIGVVAEMERQKHRMKITTDPKREQVERLEKEHSRIQTEKINHQYTKVKNEDEKKEKRAKQAQYAAQLEKIKDELKTLE